MLSEMKTKTFARGRPMRETNSTQPRLRLQDSVLKVSQIWATEPTGSIPEAQIRNSRIIYQPHFSVCWQYQNSNKLVQKFFEQVLQVIYLNGSLPQLLTIADHAKQPKSIEKIFFLYIFICTQTHKHVMYNDLGKLCFCCYKLSILFIEGLLCTMFYIEVFTYFLLNPQKLC